jgi:hypothetical protein
MPRMLPRPPSEKRSPWPADEKSRRAVGVPHDGFHTEIQAAGTAAARCDVTLLHQGRKKTRALS